MVEDLLDPQPSQKLPIPMSGASNSIENQMEVEESSGQVMVNEPSPEEGNILVTPLHINEFVLTSFEYCIYACIG